jgi:hypothetical protein
VVRKADGKQIVLYLRKCNLETLLNGREHSLVLSAAHKGDAETLGSEAAGTTDTMQVRVRLVGHIVVDRNVDALNVNTAAENVSRDTDTGLELFELLVTLDTGI